MHIVTPFDDITQKVIGVLFKVHGVLRSGFAEKVYENAVCIELSRAGLGFERQKSMSVYYEEQIVGEFVADVVVEGVVLLELKALREGLNEEHLAQTINYMTCLRIPVGLLANFGRSVEHKRLLNKDLLPPQAQSSASQSVSIRVNPSQHEPS